MVLTRAQKSGKEPFVKIPKKIRKKIRGSECVCRGSECMCRGSECMCRGSECVCRGSECV